MSDRIDFEKMTLSIVELIIDRNEIDVTLESTIESIGADSLDEVEIIMACEQEFNVELDDVELDKITTLNDLVDLIFKTKGCNI